MLGRRYRLTGAKALATRRYFSVRRNLVIQASEVFIPTQPPAELWSEEARPLPQRLQARQEASQALPLGG